MNWFYAENNRQVGPVSESEFANLVARGKITPETLVWKAGMADWIPYARAVAEQPSIAVPPPGPQSAPPATDSPKLASPASEAIPAAQSPAVQTSTTCSQCGRTFPPDQVIFLGGQPICGTCKATAVLKLKEGLLPAGGFHYAGFWIRFGAKIIDGIILAVFNLTLNFFTGAAMTPTAGGEINPAQLALIFGVAGSQLAAAVAYNVYFVGKFGATPGKMACGIRIVRAEGAPVSYGRATGRFFAEWLSGLILYIGYLMAAFDEEKRSLHDRICDTRVVYKG